LFVAFLRKVVHTPTGIKSLSFTRYLNRSNSQDWFDINQIELTLPRLPAEFDGYRIVHLSDIHLGTWLTRSELANIVHAVNRQYPDTILITGDFVTYRADLFIDDLTAELNQLNPKDITLAVLGNHDHWTNPGMIRTSLKDCGIIELRNDIFPLNRGSSTLYIAGVDDLIVGEANLDLVLQKLPRSGASILLAHEPDFADLSGETGAFDLQLSGHSHGGQIILPWMGPIYLPHFGRKYYSGINWVNGMCVFTTNGLGTAELQFRLNCRPEIAVLTLHSNNNNRTYAVGGGMGVFGRATPAQTPPIFP
jgi:hypothetical protein